MKKFVPFLLLIGVSTYAQNIDSLINARVLQEETPGIAVGIYEKGKTTFYYHGLANINKQIPVNAQTLFEIGSMSKTLTTSLAAIMVGQGKLKLEDFVQKYLPDSVHVPVSEGKQITIENLATHRSGLPRMPDNFKPGDPQNPYIDYHAAQLYEFLGHYTLQRGIGEKFEYSNLGMGLMGHALTRISHQSYGELLKTLITGPLKMNHTFLNTPGQKSSNVSLGYNGSIPSVSWTWTDESVLAPAGGILSTAEDIMQFLLANLRNETTLEKAMTLTHNPRFDAGQDSLQIGLGWLIRNHLIWHNGATGGFHSYCGFDPTTKKAVVVLTNSSTGADDLGAYLLDHRLPLKKIKPFVQVDDKLLKEYTGNYALTPFFSINITQEGHSLALQGTGQQKLSMYAESDTKFFLKLVEAQIEFVRDDKGSVTKLNLIQNGRTQSGLKGK